MSNWAGRPGGGSVIGVWLGLPGRDWACQGVFFTTAHRASWLREPPGGFGGFMDMQEETPPGSTANRSTGRSLLNYVDWTGLASIGWARVRLRPRIPRFLSLRQSPVPGPTFARSRPVGPVSTDAVAPKSHRFPAPSFLHGCRRPVGHGPHSCGGPFQGAASLDRGERICDRSRDLREATHVNNSTVVRHRHVM